MQVAEVLSDLTSLRVCDHDAALTLVATYKNLPAPSTSSAAPASPVSAYKRSSTAAASTPRKRSTTTSETPVPTPTHRPSPSTQRKSSEAMIGAVDKNDVDLQRAIDLMDLHYGFKMKHVQSLDIGLQKARFDVNGAVEKLREDGKGSVDKRMK